ncbi:MAG: diaminopimelate decarboxylase family protein, partial [Chloroflexota bacterium]
MRNSPPAPVRPTDPDRPPHRALPITARVDPDGILTLGGVRVTELARRYGTPCYVYDVATIEAACTSVSAILGSGGRAHYAGKAYLAPWLLDRLAQWNMDLDACSATELAIALGAGFPADRIRLHGNNKSDEAMTLAVESRIAAIVVDNLDELRRLIDLAAVAGHPAPVVLRLNPGVEAHTHQYLETGVASSKFGLPLRSGEAHEAVELSLRYPREIALLGYHAHIGTQVQEADPYVALMAILIQFAQNMREARGFWPSQLSPGGGPGITYTDEPALPLSDWLGPILAALDHLPAERRPSLHVEPGRSVVGPAGVALYT